MQLRLAEYKDGKFERFLELTDADLFVSPSGMIEFEKEGFLLGKDSILVLSMFDGFNDDYYNKDKKDPLNRFDGLFDGRTYGEGRFVLVKDGEDDVKITYNSPVLPFYNPPYFDDPKQKYELKEMIFNIHENPQLWEKVK